MIIPAIDLIEGSVVRLYQGDYAQKTEYSVDPVTLVNQYADEGAQWLHIVDLTGAKDTSKRQLALIKAMADSKPRSHSPSAYRNPRVPLRTPRRTQNMWDIAPSSLGV